MSCSAWLTPFPPLPQPLNTVVSSVIKIIKVLAGIRQTLDALGMRLQRSGLPEALGSAL